MELSIIVPSYNEKENIEGLLKNIYAELKAHKIKGEVIVVDDNSPDGTGKLLEKLKTKYKTLGIIHRKRKLGLSSAAIEGFAKAKSDILCLMDADHSHPIEKIPMMYKIIKEDKADIVIGSRYVKGGRSINTRKYREIVSKLGAYLSRTFTSVKDSMSGFFMFKRICIKDKTLNPKGFKILLEILVKSRCTRVKEIPITFVNRKRGRSKAKVHQVYYFFYNTFSYFRHKKSLQREFFLFAGIGLIGTIVNLAFMYLFTEFFNIHYLISALIAFVFALTNNFILNKIWTFKEKISEKFITKYLQFFSVSMIALVVNLIFLFLITEYIGLHYMIAQVIAIAIANIFNFFGNKVWTFSK